MKSGDTVVAETPRLLLRLPTWQDLDFFTALHIDRDVMRYIGEGMPRPPEETRRWLGEWIADAEGQSPPWLREVFTQLKVRNYPFGIWTVVLKSANVPVGRCGLLAQNVDDVWEPELSYLFAKSFWGQGLATEAARAARDVAFDRHGLPRLISLVQPGNLAGQHVAVKNGMAPEKDTRFKGQAVRVYAMTAGNRSVE